MKIFVDKDKCTKCNLCISDCVAKCLIKDEENYPILENEENCLNCKHCFMICPNGAINLEGQNIENAEKPNFNDILSTIKSRRSIRQFKNEELDNETMEKLKNMLSYVPTGCNFHKLHFSIVKNHCAMKKIKEITNKKVLKLMNSVVLSPFIKHFKIYKEAMESGEDIIYRNAPHMIIASSPVNAPCANIDPIIALSYFELYANSLGIGTCFCGYAAICMKMFPELSIMLDIPKNYIPIYVMLFGKSNVKYQRIANPEKYEISEITELENKKIGFLDKTRRAFINFLR